MRGVAAAIAPATSAGELDQAIGEALAALTSAETQESRLVDLAGKAREEAARRRLELGRELARARALFPARGPKAAGWGKLLARHNLAQQRASEYMRLAGYVDEQAEDEVSPASAHDGETGRVPTMAEAGIDKRPRARDEAARDAVGEDLAPAPERAREAQDDEDKPDRDSYCTPLEYATALGPWDLDPCSNDRSHIQAKKALRLDRGEDGITMAKFIPATARAFINPPYSRPNVGRFVEAYKHVRFCFLLKFDCSTRWFEELIACTELVLLPKRTRIEFEPPPGVVADSNQFPHAFFFARAEDATPEIRALCYELRTGGVS